MTEVSAQCGACEHIDYIDGYPEQAGGAYFCNHDVFDGLDAETSKAIEASLFLLAQTNNCPRFKQHKR